MRIQPFTQQPDTVRQNGAATNRTAPPSGFNVTNDDDYINYEENSQPWNPSVQNTVPSSNTMSSQDTFTEFVAATSQSHYSNNPLLQLTQLPKLSSQLSPFEKVLVQWTGGNLEVLAECPLEKNLFINSAIGIIASMGLAMMAGTFFANNMLKIPMPWALLGGAIQAVIVGTADTLLVRNMRPPRIKKPALRFVVVVLSVIPRFVLSFALAFIINTPLEAWMFRGEIDAAIQTKMEQSRREVDTALEQSVPAKEIAKRVKQFDEEKKKLKDKNNEIKEARNLALNEEQGTKALGLTGYAGTGPATYRIDRTTVLLERELADMEKHVAIKEGAIKGKQEEAQAQLDSLRKEQYAKVKASDGPLLRQATMHELIFHGRAMSITTVE